MLQLLTRLKKLYNIPTQNFIGHSDIARSRKSDPSILFPWKKLSESGFGIYPDEILLDAPSNFNPESGLQLIGYDIKNLPDAISAFKRHFIQTEVNNVLDQKTINAICNVYLKNENFFQS